MPNNKIRPNDDEDKIVNKESSFKYSKYFFLFLIIVLVGIAIEVGEVTDWSLLILICIFLSLIFFSPIFIYESIKVKRIKFGILIIIILGMLVIFVFNLINFIVLTNIQKH